MNKLSGMNPLHRATHGTTGVTSQLARWQLWAVGLIMGAIAFNPLGEMLFGGLGLTPEDPAWGLVMLLAFCLALSGLRLLGGVQIQARRIVQSQGMNQCLCGLSRAASGALLGFFYGGRWAEDDIRGAIAGALVGLALGLVLGWLGASWCEPLERMAGEAIAVLSAYCLGIWLGAWSLSALMTGHWGAGLAYGAIALGFVALAWQGGLGLGRSRPESPLN